ncbi:hypothetical protein WOLCODRAFT_148342 [Wolfiporia cocos MD-104 SS10]|uniref:Uncharacterized protein n=1 Tax=Wolfiporia cocos (strain MD-104) TaxID=742152 RepID=A0A2H3JE84_WOLCO|nr:hypothetical protein WOLCODRAFT_148342 [Wolfiporia cocos MD-104 SS10]
MAMRQHNTASGSRTGAVVIATAAASQISASSLLSAAPRTRARSEHRRRLRSAGSPFAIVNCQLCATLSTPARPVVQAVPRVSRRAGPASSTSTRLPGCCQCTAARREPSPRWHTPSALTCAASASVSARGQADVRIGPIAIDVWHAARGDVELARAATRARDRSRSGVRPGSRQAPRRACAAHDSRSALTFCAADRTKAGQLSAPVTRCRLRERRTQAAWERLELCGAASCVAVVLSSEWRADSLPVLSSARVACGGRRGVAGEAGVAGCIAHAGHVARRGRPGAASEARAAAGPSQHRVPRVLGHAAPGPQTPAASSQQAGHADSDAHPRRLTSKVQGSDFACLRVPQKRPPPPTHASMHPFLRVSPSHARTPRARPRPVPGHVRRRALLRPSSLLPVRASRVHARPHPPSRDAGEGFSAHSVARIQSPFPASLPVLMPLPASVTALARGARTAPAPTLRRRLRVMRLLRGRHGSMVILVARASWCARRDARMPTLIPPRAGGQPPPLARRGRRCTSELSPRPRELGLTSIRDALWRSVCGGADGSVRPARAETRSGVAGGPEPAAPRATRPSTTRPSTNPTAAPSMPTPAAPTRPARGRAPTRPQIHTYTPARAARAAPRPTSSSASLAAPTAPALLGTFPPPSDTPGGADSVTHAASGRRATHLPPPISPALPALRCAWAVALYSASHGLGDTAREPAHRTSLRDPRNALPCTARFPSLPRARLPCLLVALAPCVILTHVRWSLSPPPGARRQMGGRDFAWRALGARPLETPADLSLLSEAARLLAAPWDCVSDNTCPVLARRPRSRRVDAIRTGRAIADSHAPLELVHRDGVRITSHDDAGRASHHAVLLARSPGTDVRGAGQRRPRAGRLHANSGQRGPRCAVIDGDESMVDGRSACAMPPGRPCAGCGSACDRCARGSSAPAPVHTSGTGSDGFGSEALIDLVQDAGASLDYAVRDWLAHTPRRCPNAGVDASDARESGLPRGMRAGSRGRTPVRSIPRSTCSVQDAARLAAGHAGIWGADRPGRRSGRRGRGAHHAAIAIPTKTSYFEFSCARRDVDLHGAALDRTTGRHARMYFPRARMTWRRRAAAVDHPARSRRCARTAHGATGTASATATSAPRKAAARDWAPRVKDGVRFVSWSLCSVKGRSADSPLARATLAASFVNTKTPPMTVAGDRGTGEMRCGLGCSRDARARIRGNPSLSLYVRSAYRYGRPPWIIIELEAALYPPHACEGRCGQAPRLTSKPKLVERGGSSRQPHAVQHGACSLPPPRSDVDV